MLRWLGGSWPRLIRLGAQCLRTKFHVAGARGEWKTGGQSVTSLRSVQSDITLPAFVLRAEGGP